VTKAAGAGVGGADCSIGQLLRAVSQALERALGTRAAAHQISTSQWRVLHELCSEDELSQRELSRRLEMREPSVAYAVGRLVRAGLARRVQDPNDRRKVRVGLSRRAVELEAILLPIVVEVNALALRGLSEAEAGELRRLIGAVSQNLAGDLTAATARGKRRQPRRQGSMTPTRRLK
jgi:DNA-binding MarR family transcriptional regulator